MGWSSFNDVACLACVAGVARGCGQTPGSCGQREAGGGEAGGRELYRGHTPGEETAGETHQSLVVTPQQVSRLNDKQAVKLSFLVG